jgi:hypothetical protein
LLLVVPFFRPLNGDKTLRNEANDLFSALNQAGSIS